MPAYLARLRARNRLTTVVRIEVPDLEGAQRSARSLARDRDAIATNVNLVERFRLRPGELMEDSPVGGRAANETQSDAPVGLAPLDDQARREIAGVALRGLRVGESVHLRRLGAKLVDDALWFWTADALRRGEYARDAVKRELAVLPHTRAASNALSPNDLRHEHSVPRRVVRAHLESAHNRWSEVPDRQAIAEIACALDRCAPVLVTVDEDRRLSGSLRSGMGERGAFHDPPFARYVRAGLIKDTSELVFPLGGFWTESGRYRSTATHECRCACGEP
jgi:hypothetical protein